MIGRCEVHGTSSAYVSGCRCDDCRRANRDYKALRKAGGSLSVPVVPVANHIRALRRLGMSNNRIASLAGVDRNTVAIIERCEVRNVHLTTAKKLAAVRGPQDVRL